MSIIIRWFRWLYGYYPQVVPGRVDGADNEQPALPDLPFCSRRRVCRHHTQVHHDDDDGVGGDGGDDDDENGDVDVDVDDGQIDDDIDSG